MKITKTCGLDGKTYTMEIPLLTPDKLADGMEKYENGMLIQDAFNYLNADEREFLMTGTPPEVWDKLIGPEDEDESWDALTSVLEKRMDDEGN